MADILARLKATLFELLLIVQLQLQYTLVPRKFSLLDNGLNELNSNGQNVLRTKLQLYDQRKLQFDIKNP